MVAWGEIVKWAVIGLMALTGMGTLVNVAGAITGQNPMAQATGAMLQNMIPIIITLMPVVMIMNMFMSIIQGITAPFTMLARMVPQAPVMPQY
jgi:hypothetical protein